MHDNRRLRQLHISPREAFGLPDIEISPRRHLIVSRQAGGWTLGAFVRERMVGFVHHLAGVRPDNELFGYRT
jgi:predicted GNAT superfamily acetyltransferase